MTAALTGAVELLDRSLAYTRVALAEAERLPRSTPTPCHGWPVRRLLAHMDDGLDAWTEAACGRVSPAPVAGGSQLDSIRGKACALLGWWLEHPPVAVGVGDRTVLAEVLVGAAALEITLHGWDLHAAAGPRVPVPEPLAVPLLEVAASLGEDPLPCFGPPVAPPPQASASARLTAFVGRG